MKMVEFLEIDQCANGAVVTLIYPLNPLTHHCPSTYTAPINLLTLV